MKLTDYAGEDLSNYSRVIIEETGCEIEDASKIENIMRDLSSRTSLDGLSRAELRKEARDAHADLVQNRTIYVEYFAGVRRSFDEGKARTQMETTTS